jgi:hypothetical protein
MHPIECLQASSNNRTIILALVERNSITRQMAFQKKKLSANVLDEIALLIVHGRETDTQIFVISGASGDTYHRKATLAQRILLFLRRRVHQ